MTLSHSADWSPPDPDQLAGQLERCQILGTLGRGGMGAVYRARQTGLDREVAVKVLPKELSEIPDLERRFGREARALAGLDHPHIVRVFDVGRTADGHSYIMMEFVAGRDLADVITHGGLQPNDSLRVVMEICEALEHAHARGLVHRDIKPSNVLLDAEGHVKLADFGLALPALTPQGEPVSRLTASGNFLGTLEYMAPEQLAGREVDHRADLYATGVLFYELLTGDIPRGSWKPPSSLRPLNPKLDAVIQRLLEPKPEDRFQSAAELRTAVQALLPSTRQTKKSGALWIAALIAMGFATVLFLLQRNVPPPAEAPVVADSSPNLDPSTRSPAPLVEIPAKISVPASPSAPISVEPQNTPTVPPSPAPHTPTEPSLPDDPLSDLAHGGRMLADFSKSASWTLEGSWTADSARWQNSALMLSTVPAGAGTLSWPLAAGNPVDLSNFATAHWTVEARLTREPAAVLLLTLVDVAGRKRSWRLKPESFFTDRARRHVHYLALERADFQNPTEGFGPLLEDAGFDLSAVVTAKIEPDPQSPPPPNWGWQILRIGL